MASCTLLDDDVFSFMPGQGLNWHVKSPIARLPDTTHGWVGPRIKAFGRLNVSTCDTSVV